MSAARGTRRCRTGNPCGRAGHSGGTWSLTGRVAMLEMRDAARRERDIHIERRFDRLEALQKETHGILSRFGWLIIATVVAAVLASHLDGRMPGISG